MTTTAEQRGGGERWSSVAGSAPEVDLVGSAGDVVQDRAPAEPALFGQPAYGHHVLAGQHLVPAQRRASPVVTVCEHPRPQVVKGLLQIGPIGDEVAPRSRTAGRPFPDGRSGGWAAVLVEFVAERAGEAFGHGELVA